MILAKRFFVFHGEMPAEPAPAVIAYLEFLALERKVAPATQGQALNAQLFLYRETLEQDLGSYLHPRAQPPGGSVRSPADMFAG